jgi:hypothetical protein
MDVILAQRNLPEHSKSFLIYIKNTMKYDIDVTHDNIVLRTGRHLINNVRTAKIKISDISIVRNKIHIAGYILTCCDNDYFHFTVNDSSIRNFEIDEVDIDFLGIPWLFYKRFAFEIPFVNELEFKLVYSENGKHSILKNNIYYYENRRTSSRIIRNGQIILFENNKIILLNNSIKDKLKTYYEKLVKYLKSKGV